MKKRARFIAGAICPACGAIDRIVVKADVDGRVQQCVQCHHEDAMPVDSIQVESRAVREHTIETRNPSERLKWVGEGRDNTLN